MASVLDENVHNLAADGTLDDCQDFVKALFGHEYIDQTTKLANVNSINWALSQSLESFDRLTVLMVKILVQ